MRKFFVLILCFATALHLHAISPQQADSLHNVVVNTKSDSLRVSALNKLAFHYLFNDISRAEELLLQSGRIAVSKHLKHGMNEIIYTRGVIHDVSGRKDSAYFYFNKSLEFSRKHGHKVIEIRSLNGLGMNSWNSAKYQPALDFFFRAMELNEKLPAKDQLSASIFLNNIGLIYQELKLFDKALEYHLKAYEIRKAQNLVKDIVSSLNNIGICYDESNKPEIAEQYFQEGLKLALSSQNYIDYFKLSNNLADTYIVQKKYQKAVDLILSIIDDSSITGRNPRNNILAYGKMAIAFSKLRKPDEAIQTGEKALEILRNDSSLRSLADDVYYALTMAWYLKGDYEKADYYLQKYHVELRRNHSKENSLAIAEMEVKYETGKKEAALAISAQKLRSQRIFTAFSLTFVVLILVVLYLFFLNRDKRTRLKIANQESRVAGLLVEAEQNERSRIARDLHDGVSQKLAVIQMHLSMEENSSGTQNLNSLLQKTIDDVRTISHNLYPPDLDKGLVPALTHLCDQNNFVNRKTVFELILHGLNDDLNLNSNTQHLIFRIVQEITNNALKYAEATKVDIVMNLQKNVLLLSVADNGIGFDISDVGNTSGIGLKNITERVNQIGGEIEIKSEIGVGTTFNIKIPVTSWSKG
jgi:signal transduction histidine kinase/Flp pilus assembly protein TadD